ncbi:MAG: type II secretion system F family protein [Candidatus Pacearchaeota archaeon]
MKKEKERLLEELKIGEEEIKRIKKIEIEKKEKVETKAEKEKVNFFIVLANIIFRKLSLRLVHKKFFEDYKYKLRKAGIPLITSSYISLIFFITLVTFIFSMLFAIFISIGNENLAITLIKNCLISLIFTIVIFFLILFYPNIVIKNEERKVDAELPFAILYMASIASAGVQPLKVFNLLSESGEYTAVARQIKKITNQINVLGVDIITAIKTTGKIIINKKLVDLINGLATNIMTGGDLKLYLEEQAKKTLTDYKIAREKFTESAGIYSDIYTGLLIAAPLIFMLVLVLINAFGGTIAGISISVISLIGIAILVLLNIIFLVYLQIVTPPI